MSTLIPWLVSSFTVVVALSAIFVNDKLRLWGNKVDFRFGCFQAANGTLSAVVYLIVDRNPVGVMWAAGAALGAYIAWRSRPPRKRRPSKVLGRVRDLGHKLAVTS